MSVEILSPKEVIYEENKVYFTDEKLWEINNLLVKKRTVYTTKEKIMVQIAYPYWMLDSELDELRRHAIHYGWNGIDVVSKSPMEIVMNFWVFR